jgi:hypothetical protein
MAFTSAQVADAMARYAVRPRNTSGILARFPAGGDAPGPAWLSLARSIELVLTPYITAPFRGIILVQLEDPKLEPVLSHLLPILAEQLRTGGAIEPEAAPPPAPPMPSPEMALEALADPWAPESRVLAFTNWFEVAEFQLETYTNSPTPPPAPLKLHGPRLASLRPQLDQVLLRILRENGNEAILKLLPDGHPG